ncbi:hypothetical protein [Haliangium sp.]|uniref:hypothetical protein n=1 Tax=Haliangium sp. TaxID=2663208 RepID=UPI003D10D810
MIRIRRPAEAPPTLRGRGVEARRALEAAYDANPGAYDAGDESFDIDSNIYAAKDVKETLIAMQHGKCAFCEAKITHVTYGDVEHFRPKRGWQQTDADELQRPGYYWLAYEWKNLLLSCQLCNQRHKRNLFPLLEPAQRARRHYDDLDAEKPLFLDPSSDDPDDDPARHITFHGADPTPVKESTRGRSTIGHLGLSRDELREHRMSMVAHLKSIRDLRDSLVPLIASAAMSPDQANTVSAGLRQANDLLHEAVQPTAEYSAMARALLKSELR